MTATPDFETSALQLTDEQKIALAISLANTVTDARQASGLMRLARVADQSAMLMLRDAYEGESA
ncbi:hypothetical protein SAMN05421853_10274 [Roseivivax halotolerans]|uniref:Uncharacterized protein n=1 Tax=Roseivivax halotolerans TaxID=93684 RepID=A0A1I5W1X6_9RHOB|nr:hypothetical protein [Roseivivax halotolerans]SFQ13597.1 hypothetical protein SAMN05421853_10274 [Roseivivax halotolerans]